MCLGRLGSSQRLSCHVDAHPTRWTVLCFGEEFGGHAASHSAPFSSPELSGPNCGKQLLWTLVSLGLFNLYVKVTLPGLCYVLSYVARVGMQEASSFDQRKRPQLEAELHSPPTKRLFH